jgi:hypothetical protein
MRDILGMIAGYALMAVGLVGCVVALMLVCREESRRRSEAEAACPCGSKACPGRAVVKGVR